ncbi:L-ribulose-5-phosphate 4-epimerase [Caloramator quimbayensis]|uniref:L-ribulose-5-phosphate 4-epimerase n=1 Tax=Caloramator quimbayensis TaxID=1147123 RepID=A0A1T4Y9R5_9CLOT|nr:MFS transporter [Caloramator quimbayensis]SKA98258.1 L-ribulose-5-phosphate 4-epimerase [Caloramator quimbayensis]
MKEYKVYPYRWVVLFCTLPILAMTNVFWLTFAPITSQAIKFYNVPPIYIAFLSMIYMIVYIVAALPVSYLIDKKGFKISMLIGSLLTAVFGMLRGIFADNYIVVSLCQTAIAFGQPFLVNSITKIAANWFPLYERATASGIATMAGYIGMIAAMLLSPRLYLTFGLPKLLMQYGYASVFCAIIFIIFSKEKPENTVDRTNKEEFTFSKTKSLLSNNNFARLMVCMFVLMGIFNAVMTWIEEMLRPKGINSVQAGTIGGILIIVGLIGAVILPMISDRIKKRKPLLIWPILFSVIPFAVLTFSNSYTAILISCAAFGFFIMGMGPIAFQYGAEIAYPIPEGTSFGILMLMGQISGVIFIFLMDYLGNLSGGNMVYSLYLFTVLIFFTFLYAIKFKESPLILTETKENFDNDYVIKLRHKLCEGGLRLLESGLVSGTWGNLSLRINNDYMIITPSGIPYKSLKPEDMVIVNINDLSYDGELNPSGESGLHAEIYKNRKEINAVIHTHSQSACTVAASRLQVPPLLDDMAQIIGPSIRVADYAIPGTKKLIKNTIKALKGRNGVLLANHGAVCIGRSLNEAFTACEILEKSCKTFIEAKLLEKGVPLGKFESYVMHQYFLKKYSKKSLTK